ncbi:MAG TPA: cytochrome C oxidase subunit IV family protein [Thermoplasmata archaeon]|nr:cytochrome C oxidase subunit IV family protein [Thermoplasmata archaeon]
MATEAAAATQAATPVEEGHKRPYVYVFIVLAVVTVIEVFVSGVQGLAELDKIMLLVGLATAKASLVVAYYMHLRYEPRWLMLIPFGGLALVFILVAALIASAGHVPVPP